MPIKPQKVILMWHNNLNILYSRYWKLTGSSESFFAINMLQINKKNTHRMGVNYVPLTLIKTLYSWRSIQRLHQYNLWGNPVYTTSNIFHF